MISSKTAAVPSHQHKRGAPKDGTFANESGSNQGQAGPRSKTSANDEVKPGIDKVAIEQSRALGEKVETKTEVGASSQQPPNRIVRFPKPNHLIYPGLRQKRTSKTTMPGMTPVPRWCPLGLTPSQRSRIQWMRAQKLREEAAEKDRDEHFNTIGPVISMKQEWRVKEKASNPALMTSNNDMDLLDDDESPLIKDGSPPLTGMDINMVFTLPAEFRGADEEVAQMCLDPKEAMFEKPEVSSQHLKPLYIRGHIDGKPISRMLIDGGAVVNLMP
jgi:hypothetical protein